MKTTRKISVWLMVLALSLSVLTGCGTKPESPAPQETPGAAPSPAPGPVTVKVGNVSSILFAPFYVALEKGYFVDEGIQVKLESLQAGQDAMVFLANGQLDFVLAGYSAALFNSVSRGMDLKVIAPMGIQPAQAVGDPSPLMVRADLVSTGEVKTAGDLRGKRIGIAGGVGGTGSFLAALRLQKYGLSLKDVEILPLGLADHETGLVNKSVDAALMAEPFATKTVQDGAGTPVDKGMLAGVNASGLLTSGKMLNEQREVVNGFTTALLRAARDLQGENFKTDEHIQIFAKYTKLAPDVIRAVVPYHFDPNFDLSAPKRDLAAMQEIFADAGVLKLQNPVSVSQVIDEGPAAAAVAKLGKK